MQIRSIDAIDDIPAREWNALICDDNPFLDHAFLAALEHHGAVGNHSGWHPRHLIATDNGRLCGAVPLYLKDHSFGEFVFDWAWAHAYARAGIDYYPKLVAAVPYTPVTGNRLLTGDLPQHDEIARLLIDAAREFTRNHEISSLHFLFIDDRDKRLLEEQDLLTRYGCQFHWFNQGYANFDDFLAALTARHRKNIRRERRRISEQDITVECLHGDHITPEQWSFFHRCYQSTFDKKTNIAPLSPGFFQEIGRKLGTRVVLMLARQQQRPVASALFLRNQHTLFGRYWGCIAEFDRLHFELCYYQAIDYCIEHGLRICEAGAQGEHKIGRGFTPVITCSSHWIAEPRFRTVIQDFLQHEQKGIERYIADMRLYLPFRDRN